LGGCGSTTWSTPYFSQASLECIVLCTVNLVTYKPYLQKMIFFFFEWWIAASTRVDDLVKKGFDSLLILRALTIWKHRNRYVFYGIIPNVSCVVSVIKEDLHQWSFAGARRVSHVLALGSQGGPGASS
jgi:hypothetical protein